jgi:hypothetical protein
MLVNCRLKPGLSAVMLLCTLCIFLFPAAAGPYSVVHGPVTALRALQAAVAALWSIAFAGLSLSLGVRPSAAMRGCPPWDVKPAASGNAIRETVLRC